MIDAQGVMPRIPRKGDIVKAITSRGIARAKGWVTPVIQGEVLAVTEKGILVRGAADVYDDDSCMICGITLRKFESRFAHIGPICAKKTGLFYPTDTELTEDQRQEIRDRIRNTWSGEEWLPRAWTTFTVLEEVRGHHTLADRTPEKAEYRAPENDSNTENRASRTSPNHSLCHSSHKLGANDVTPAVVEKIDVRFSIETLQTAKSQGQYIVCRSQYAHKERCTAVSPRHWDPAIEPFPPSFPRPGAWCYPVSPVLAHQLKAAFEGVAVRRGTPQFAELLKQSATMAEAGAIKEQDESTLPEIPVTKTKAWSHQVRAFHFTKKIWGE